MDKEKALARVQRQNDYINKYSKENYDKICVLLPKGTKDRIRQIPDTTVNGFINKLVEQELTRLGL